MKRAERIKRAERLVAMFNGGEIPPGSFFVAIGELGFGPWAKTTPRRRKGRCKR